MIVDDWDSASANAAAANQPALEDSKVNGDAYPQQERDEFSYSLLDAIWMRR